MFSRSVESNSLRPSGHQHAKLPCPSLRPRVCSDSTSIESVMPCNHLIFCCLLLLLPLVFPSIKVFCNELAVCIRWPKYWSFSFSISPSNEYSGLISFKIDWFDLLAVQGSLKSIFQHHNSKASILQCSAFFMVQLSHPYMTTGKTIALIIHVYNCGKHCWLPVPNHQLFHHLPRKMNSAFVHVEVCLAPGKKS